MFIGYVRINPLQMFFVQEMVQSQFATNNRESTNT